MKKVILSIAAIGLLSLTNCKSETKSSTNNTSKEIAITKLSFGVRGNCVMCKSTIEKAANSVDGVASANWDVDKKKINVSFDNSITNVMTIHNAIAASGYDTEKVLGNEEAYGHLADCCQYDRKMTMNQAGETKSGNQGKTVTNLSMSLKQTTQILGWF